MRGKLKNNILFQPVKKECYMNFFIALGKALFHGSKGQLDISILSFMDAAAAIGLEETDERLAWKLVDRAVVNAIIDIVEENKNNIPPPDGDSLIKSITKLKYDKDINIDPDFFNRPKECQFVKDIQELLREWLILAGVESNRVESIVNRFPGFFVYSLHDEWLKDSGKY